ncbi:2-dehydro-3-deoxyphosphooctonate aldolase [Flavobacterium litorale]|uniref:2-dehydro-3-deoxyphosphooctonate aldolase n=1 Tax=Flavobacterium litorale TaxID=2856519 RepID=A0ABX8V406_9FLAO|nr:2-dehydro-3-deoxyphosphooctonate aldolase [Flavobacterium litorale]QYJ67579.1 2-dehydro-3-deoxyphosphooctonate aldolase [Flavobacterium litorale]
MKKYLFLSFVCFALIISCVSTRLTIKNIDDKARMPALSEEKTFVLTKISSNNKYGYDPDYPVNLGFLPVQNGGVNIKRYFGALSGPQGQKISYEHVDSCCPFPSEKNNMGAGILEIYEVTWEGLATPKRIHINLYERGEIIAPAGFGIKQVN